MTLFEQINKDLLEARTSRDQVKADVLRTLISEIQTIFSRTESKDSPITDAFVQPIVVKFVKSLTEMIAARNQDKDKLEYSIIVQYLPKQLSEEELLNIIKEVNGSLGETMKHLKLHYANQYDGKIVSRLYTRV